jgi:hypothetical protein
MLGRNWPAMRAQNGWRDDSTGTTGPLESRLQKKSAGVADEAPALQAAQTAVGGSMTGAMLVCASSCLIPAAKGGLCFDCFLWLISMGR